RRRCAPFHLGTDHPVAAVFAAYQPVHSVASRGARRVSSTRTVPRPGSSARGRKRTSRPAKLITADQGAGDGSGVASVDSLEPVTPEAPRGHGFPDVGVTVVDGSVAEGSVVDESAGVDSGGGGLGTSG